MHGRPAAGPPAKRKRPRCRGAVGATLRTGRRRRDSVVALGQVVVGHHFGRGPLQRLALAALALGLLDRIDGLPAARRFMARITVEDCLQVIDNRFELVMMAAKRARQLANGVEPQLDNSENDDQPTVLALREIAARVIDPDYVEAVEKSERERREHEALEWAAAEVVAVEDMYERDD